MQPSRSLALLTILVATALAAQSAEQDPVPTGYRLVPINVSLIPPLAVAGSGENAIVRVGFHLIAGKSARLEGVEVGLVNIQTESARSLQAAALMNYVGGPMRGVQASGFVNVASGPVHGVQAAGFVNWTADQVDGTQASGFVNAARGNATLQATGVVNYAGMSAETQTSGVVNIAREAAEMQLSGLVNYTQETFLQIGTFNITTRSKGAQIGLVNIAAQQDGVPIGAFSYVKGVPIRLATWGDETGFANLAVVSGIPTVYSMAVVGHRVIEDREWWAIGYGFGGHSVRGATFYQLDSLFYTLFEAEAVKRRNAVNRVRFAVGQQLASRFAVYAGVSLNTWASTDSDGDAIIPWSILSEKVGRMHFTVWPGVYAGLRF